MSSLTRSIVGVGACYLDTILTVPSFPQEDGKLRASQLERRRGGNVPNTLEVLGELLEKHSSMQAEQLDPRHSPPALTLLSVLPSAASVATRQIQSSLGAGVELSHCWYREASLEAPSSYILRCQATNSRTIINYNDLQEMSDVEFIAAAEKLKDRAKVYHFEGRIPEVTLECVRWLRWNQPSALISVEVEKPKRPGLEELAQDADIVFHSRSWAEAQGYKGPEECVHGQQTICSKASYLFCTWGEQGAAAIQRPGSKAVFSGPYKVDRGQIVDTIGAGDTFIAGALYGIVYRSMQWDLLTMLRFANELAGRKVMQEGFYGLSAHMRGW